MPNRDLDVAMIRAFTRPIPLVLALAFCTFIPVMMATVRVVQIPLGALPEDSLRLASAPVALFFHSLAGALFGVSGPLQFVRAVRRRFAPWSPDRPDRDSPPPRPGAVQYRIVTSDNEKARTHCVTAKACARKPGASAMTFFGERA